MSSRVQEWSKRQGSTLWLTRDATNTHEGIGVWTIRPEYCHGVVWWAFVEDHPIASYYDDITAKLCKGIFRAVPDSGEIIEIPVI